MEQAHSTAKEVKSALLNIETQYSKVGLQIEDLESLDGRKSVMDENTQRSEACGETIGGLLRLLGDQQVFTALAEALKDGRKSVS